MISSLALQTLFYTLNISSSHFNEFYNLIQAQFETGSLRKLLQSKNPTQWIPSLYFYFLLTVGWPQVYFASCWRILLQRSLTTDHNADKKIQKWVYDWWQSLPSEACGSKASGVIRWSWRMERRHGKGSFGTCFHRLITLSKTLKNVVMFNPHLRFRNPESLSIQFLMRRQWPSPLGVQCP